MYVSYSNLDVACVGEWYGIDNALKNYKALKLPKIPLLLASMSTEQTAGYRSIVEADGWREVCWYPSCHHTLAKGPRITIFCKKQNVSPLEEMPFVRNYDGSRARETPAFNRSLPLHCSVTGCETHVKLTPKEDMHRIIGLHRMTRKSKKNVFNNWRKFATTSLASYWYWGLAPDETDVHKYEK